MTVAELLARVSSKELTEWMIFSQLEPFGSEAYFLGHAVTASTVANVNRGKRKQAMSLDKFMPKFGRKKEQSVDDMIGMAAHVTQLFGGKDLRKK